MTGAGPVFRAVRNEQGQAEEDDGKVPSSDVQLLFSSRHSFERRGGGRADLSAQSVVFRLLYGDDEDEAGCDEKLNETENNMHDIHG